MKKKSKGIMIAEEAVEEVKNEIKEVKKEAKKEVKVVQEEKDHVLQLLLHTLADREKEKLEFERSKIEEEKKNTDRLLQIVNMVINTICWIFCFYFIATKGS